MGKAMTYHCTSCGKPLSEHLGIVGTCACLQDCRTRMELARAFLLKIWPKGENCEHQFARAAFELLAAPAPAPADSVSADTHRERQSNGQ